MTGSDASSVSSSDAPSLSPSSLSSKAAAKNPSATSSNGHGNANANGNSSSNGNGNNGNANGSNTVCKNCFTVTTPLWRRDENGAVLCNACGLFLKLHGRPRPISLKTDVIKSRNRKGNHYQNHHDAHASDAPPLSPKGSFADDRRRRHDEIKPLTASSRGTKRTKMERPHATLDGPLHNGDSTSDVRSAANTLENIMAGDSNHKPKSRARNEVSSPTALPHLSSLLGANSKQSPLPPPATMLDGHSAISSPSMLPQNPKGYHMSSISDVLGTSSQQQQQQQVALADGPAAAAAVRGTTHYTPVSPPQRAMTSIPLPPPPPLPRVSSPAPVNASLGAQLRNEEEIIRLKTRINELELVTDLYKRHIFELDEKCGSLQDEMRQLKH